MQVILTESQIIQLSEKINKDQIKLKDKLNPSLFENNKMIPEVRDKLLVIAKDFYEFLKINWVNYTDIILVGSNANYNWTPQSDIDVHIILPYLKINSNKKIVEDLMWAMKSVWLDDHDIQIDGFNVEMYGQDSQQKDLYSGGVYSILYDKWIEIPSKLSQEIDYNQVDSLVDQYEKQIDQLIKDYESGNCDGIVADVEDLSDIIYDLRRQGFEEGGEFSEKNVAFRLLRHTGKLDKLNDIKSEVYDNTLSLGSNDGSSNGGSSNGGTSNTANNIFPEKKEKSFDDLTDKDIEKIRASKSSLNSKNDDESKDEKVLSNDKEATIMINGKKYKSVRDAAKELKIPKSTVHYRIKSDSSNWAGWKYLN